MKKNIIAPYAKSSEQGFGFILVLIIVAILAIGGGAYVYTKNEHKKDVAHEEGQENRNSEEVSIQTNGGSNVHVTANQNTPVVNTQLNANVHTDLIAATGTKSKITYVLAGDVLSVLKDGKKVQVVSLDAENIPTLALAHAQPFIYDKDINFDGQADVGIFTGTGYGGVNNFYSFYLANTTDGRVDTIATLKEISNPGVDASKKQVISSYRSGPQWYKDTYQFNGSGYVKIGDSVPQLNQ